MAIILSIIYANSYFILLLAAAFNSATVAVMGGVAAHSGYVNIFLGITFLTLGASIFNQIYFYLGKRLAHFFNQDKLHQSHKITKVMSLMNKHQIGFILIYRFIPGVRFISPFILGASIKLSVLKFLIFDSIASLIWSCVFFSIGFACGAVAKKAFANVQHYENIVFLIILVIVVILFISKKLLSKKN
ncbi:VTT domain-containing protein [Thiotrichales bacterium 19S3-7]|nr:VTT domain-containing protein [Thiotrichales bacterium 19S3-7]MCF6801636.1 VTT domain-containing protein [Thiotrichales bacterium 19S3-11]